MRQFLTTVVTSALLTNSALAFPTGFGSAKPQVASQKPAKVHTEDFFEDLIGRKMSASEVAQIQILMEEAEDLRSKPQKVSTFGGTEIIPLVCGQFKISADWVKGFGGEINPCFDPMSGKSYIMKGTSLNFASSASMALMGGVYVGPASEHKAVVGQYGFVGLTKDVIPFVKFHGQVSVDLPCLEQAINLGSKKTWEQTVQECKFMAMGGLGISVSDLFTKFKNKFSKTPVTTGSATSVPGIGEINVGITFEVREFPWYDRLRNGQSLKLAFSDWQTYVAP